ncbi:MAG: 4Fe-4S ferredoxin [Defluviitaleaceae bacterium]|nr:4Fe-4S ferredoxin [Defluviitaleaceae bacterium]MCL2275099.1 4Fe-4S ferredoxin [Defluviitaleaceae bacterium]
MNEQEKMRTRAKELHAAGIIKQVLAWEAGAFPSYPAPAFFTKPNAFEKIVYNEFCTANLSKYVINITEKTLIFLRPCDAHSFAQLVKENQVKRENTYVIAVGCEGCVQVDEGEARDLLESCRTCTKTDYPLFDEEINTQNNPRESTNKAARFAEVTRLDSEENTARYAFWQAHFSQCIRCNACRNICPTCHCKECVMDSDHPLDGQFYHAIRALHQDGRCTDCGQCSRVCPRGIPVHLLNRKLIYTSNK